MAANDHLLAILLAISFLVSEMSCELSISKESMQVEPGEVRIVYCRDKYGQPVFWKGPKGQALGDDSHPKVEDRTFGKLLLFDGTRLEDTGEYKCYTKDRKEKKIFTLTVEVSDTTTKPDTYYCRTCTKSHRQTINTEEPVRITNTDRYNEGSNRNKDELPEPNEIEEEPIQLNCPDHVTVNEFQDAKLECKVKNGKNYSMTWTSSKHNELTDPEKYEYQRNEEIVIVKRADKDDNGEVFFPTVINNLDGAQYHSNITLVVYHKPYHFMSDSEIYVEKGTLFNLSCNMESNPAPFFKWEKQGKKQRFSKTTDTSTEISIMIDEDTVGSYLCTAWNSQGSTEKIFNVYMGSIPNPPEAIDVLGEEDDNLIINVTLSEEEVDPHPTALLIEYKRMEEESWMLDEYPFNDTVIFPLNHLQRGKAYEFRAASKNLVGVSKFTNSTIFEISFAVSIRPTHPLFLIMVTFYPCLLTYFST